MLPYRPHRLLINLLGVTAVALAVVGFVSEYPHDRVGTVGCAAVGVLWAFRPRIFRR